MTGAVLFSYCYCYAVWAVKQHSTVIRVSSLSRPLCIPLQPGTRRYSPAWAPGSGTRSCHSFASAPTPRRLQPLCTLIRRLLPSLRCARSFSLLTTRLDSMPCASVVLPPPSNCPIATCWYCSPFHARSVLSYAVADCCAVACPLQKSPIIPPSSRPGSSCPPVC